MNAYYQTLIGIIKLTYENNYLIKLDIVEEIGKDDEKNKFTDMIYIQLKEYLKGNRKKFEGIDLKLYGTDFQIQVWNEISKIPYGKTQSYKDIAILIGNENASRAVGNALNKNPIPLIIPCHRVVASNGNLTGFAYGVNLKKKLLELERK